MCKIHSAACYCAHFERKAKLHVLVQDLQIKTSTWSPLYYGELEYLLSYGAAGKDLQFYAIPQAPPHTPLPVGPSHDISRPKGRARLALAAFKLHKLLSAVNVKLPKSMLPVGKDIVSNHVNAGFSSYIHFRSDNAAVQKTVHPWSVFEDAYCTHLSWLQDMYAATANSAGLVHLVAASLRHDQARDRLSIQLKPLGLRNGDARPDTEAEACCAFHGFLHGLQALHQVHPRPTPAWDTFG